MHHSTYRDLSGTNMAQDFGPSTRNEHVTTSFPPMPVQCHNSMSPPYLTIHSTTPANVLRTISTGTLMRLDAVCLRCYHNHLHLLPPSLSISTFSPRPAVPSLPPHPPHPTPQKKGISDDRVMNLPCVTTTARLVLFELWQHGA